MTANFALILMFQISFLSEARLACFWHTEKYRYVLKSGSLSQLEISYYVTTLTMKRINHVEIPRTLKSPIYSWVHREGWPYWAFLSTLVSVTTVVELEGAKIDAVQISTHEFIWLLYFVHTTSVVFVKPSKKGEKIISGTRFCPRTTSKTKSKMFLLTKYHFIIFSLFQWIYSQKSLFCKNMT